MTETVQVKEAATEEELQQILALRYEILRKPWNQTFDSARDELEAVSINAYITGEGEQTLACGRLQKNDPDTGQVRYMAVAAVAQGRGLGKTILRYLEGKGKDWGLKTIQLQARVNAVDFYKSQGYEVVEKTFLLWGKIQHFLMQKKLSA